MYENIFWRNFLIPFCNQLLYFLNWPYTMTVKKKYKNHIITLPVKKLPYHHTNVFISYRYTPYSIANFYVQQLSKEYTAKKWKHSYDDTVSFFTGIVIIWFLYLFLHSHRMRSIQIKIDWSGSAVLLNWKKKSFFLSTKIKPKRQKIVCQHQVDFHFESVLAMYKTQKMIFESLY